MRTLRTFFWSIFVAAGAAIMAALGVWQLSRLQERRALNAEIVGRISRPPIAIAGETMDAANLEYRPVTVTGQYDFSQEVVIRNRARNSAPGVHVLTPLKIEGSEQAVLVDRGWIPYTAAAPEVRAAYHTPRGTVTVTGLLRLSQSRPSPLVPADPAISPALPRIDAWYWVNIEQMQTQMPYRLLPFFIEQSAGPDPSALPAAGSEIDLGDGPHLSYAVQWFSFATILVVGSMALARQRSGSESRKP